MEPRWTRAAKDAVGTARSAASHVWYTVSLGVINEIYWPTIERPQIRDLQFLVTDGETFFHDERRRLKTTAEVIDPDALGVRVTNADPEGRYRIVKEIIADPDQSAVLIQPGRGRLGAERQPARVRALRPASRHRWLGPTTVVWHLLGTGPY